MSINLLRSYEEEEEVKYRMLNMYCYTLILY